MTEEGRPPLDAVRGNMRGAGLRLHRGMGEKGHSIIRLDAARGIGDLQTMLDRTTERAALQRNVDQPEVGNVALFLSSDLASGITGEITFVDCGFNITGI